MNTRTLTLVLAGLAMLGPFATDTYLPSFVALGEHCSVGPVLVQQILRVYLFGYSLIFITGSTGATLAPGFTRLLVFRGMQGMALALPGMVMKTLDLFPTVRGLAASRRRCSTVPSSWQRDCRPDWWRA